MKILSQSKKELYEFEGNNLFVVDDMIFISKEVNIYTGKPGILGQYGSQEECLEVLGEIVSVCGFLVDGIYRMPEKKGEQDENK